MGEVTLKVAAEHVKAFQLAALEEMRMDADAIRTSAEESLEWHERDHPGDHPRDYRLADVRLGVRFLGEIMAIAEQVFATPEGDAVEVRGDTSQLAHTSETMARKIIEPQLKDETEIGPFDEEAVEKIGALTSALGWATGEAARLHAIATAELRAARAADPRAVAD